MLAPLSHPELRRGSPPRRIPRRGLPSCLMLDLVQMGDKFEAATAWCMKNDVNLSCRARASCWTLPGLAELLPSC
jgi:hypothetical protein